MMRRRDRQRAPTATISLLTVLAILMASGPAAVEAGFQRIEEAFELTPKQVTLPVQAGGRVVIQTCVDCSMVILRTTPLTRWQIDASRQSVRPRLFMARLREAAAQSPRTTLIFVYYKPNAMTINRIRLAAPPARKRT